MDEFRIEAETLKRAVAGTLIASRLSSPMAAAVAEVLVDADAMGHRTHGLSLLPYYLRQLETGGMATSGEVAVVQDFGASFLWQANRLPGAWVLKQALGEMVARSRDHPVVTASIAECFHIGSLQTYLRVPTDNGLICMVTTTDPSVASVAPFGGVDPILTSNPVAYGLPTSEEPILIDLCTSVASNSAIQNYQREGKRLPGKWLLDNQGNVTDDPEALQATPPGTIMPIGGADFGYKGFALGLMVEAFALALSGYGRSTKRSGFGEGVFVQVINPEFFAGRAAFENEMSLLAERCRLSRVPAGAGPVRLPGQRALERAREAGRIGIPVSRATREMLEPWLNSSDNHAV